MEENKEKVNRNLLILGIVSVGIAVLTTVVSLVVYHTSGDIYLDRSRPGFLPSKEEADNLPDQDYSFPDVNYVTEEVLEDFIKEYQEVIDYIDDLESPFSEASLSNNSLGIPEE